MARRHRRSRADELRQHIKVASGAQALCDALVTLEPDVPDFLFARKVIGDGLQLLQEQLAAEDRPKAAAEAGA